MLIEYLKQIPLFAHLKDAQLKEIASRCKTVEFRKGATIFHKTDMSTDLYIVNAGMLKAVLSDDEGDEMVLAQFDKGAFFGELSLLDGKGRSATIVADTDAELSVLTKEVFFDIMARDPRMAVSLMTVLVERLRKADDMIESLVFHEVGERLVRALLENATKPLPPEKNALQCAKLTHKELAARIGSSREAVSKCMKALATRGIIKEVNGKTMIATNALEQLKNRATA